MKGSRRNKQDRIQRGDKEYEFDPKAVRDLVKLRREYEQRQCDECGREMTTKQYNDHSGLCFVCEDMIQ